MAKAYVFTAHGGPEVESFRDLPRPVPGPGQLLVAVRAAGVNPADWKRRAGSRPPGVAPVQLPAVLGGVDSADAFESELSIETDGCLVFEADV